MTKPLCCVVYPPDQPRWGRLPTPEVTAMHTKQFSPHTRQGGWDTGKIIQITKCVFFSLVFFTFNQLHFSLLESLGNQQVYTNYNVFNCIFYEFCYNFTNSERYLKMVQKQHILPLCIFVRGWGKYFVCIIGIFQYTGLLVAVLEQFFNIAI